MVSLNVSTCDLVPAHKYNTNSMVSLYVSTGGLVPAYKYNINSRFSLYVSASGLVPAYKYKLRLKASVFKNVTKLTRKLINTEAFLKLKLRATPQEPRIKAGTLAEAINQKPWAWWTTVFKI